jgi:hypothetical protein
VTQTKTQTVVRTRQELDRALRTAALPAQEEQVLRMRYGIAAAGDAQLEFRGSGEAALEAQLVAMEQRALQAIQGHHAAAEPVDASRRASIIDRLRRL